jgi:hypothetical protein
MSNWYPGANVWEDKGSYLVKYKFDSSGKCTDIMYARAGLSNKEADEEHIHIWKVGETDQANRFRDADGIVWDLSDNDIQQILAGARPLF